METLHRFPNVSSIASHKLIFSPPTYSPKALCCRPRLRVYAFSSEKPRDKKKGKSNEDLCSEIREFLSSAALPENHVPSLKDLLQHDRKDLASIVRRRGYKRIRQLLETSTTTNSNASHTYTDNSGNEGQDDIPTVIPDVIPLVETVQETSMNLTSPKKAYILFLDGGLEIEPAAEGGQESGSDDAHKERTGNGKDLKEEKTENKVCIQQLIQTMHQMDLELNKLKQHLSEKALALDGLETEAQTKTNHIHELLSESVANLKPVEIQYQGDASTVELAGTFNGWQNRVIMKTVPSSQSTSPTQSRTSQLWSTILQLYPGIYEIKFVVDGHWTLDPRREKVFRKFTYNNILRVE